MTFAENHKLKDRCSQEWCRLHWLPRFGGWHEKYPLTVNIPVDADAAVKEWLNIKVFSGPAAFYPKRAERQWR